MATATNDFGNNGATGVPGTAYGPGQKERESKAYKKKTRPGRRDYYEKGGKTTNHDSKCRAKLAYKAARYQGPKNEYDSKGRPKPGGGDYGKFPKKPADIIKNIYKFVEDLLYPKQGSGAPWYSDRGICKGFPKVIDIGTPYPKSDEGFACIVAAHLFTSLCRELGFPAREKNIIYSNADGEWTYQTAAANIFFGGKWHFFDPWESFTEYENYLNGTGHGSVQPGMYHDAEIWVAQSPPSVTGGVLDNSYLFLLGSPTDGVWGTKAWKKLKLDGTKVIVETAQLRIGVRQGEEWFAGTTPSSDRVLGGPNVIYVQHDQAIPKTRLDPLGPEVHGYELLTLLHDESLPNGSSPFTLAVSNPSDESQEYALEVEGMPASREVSTVVEAGSLTGSIAAGESTEIPFSVTLGPPLELPPEPVTEIKGEAQSDGRIRLRWEAVPGATQYRVYRATEFQEEFSGESSELLTETSEKEFAIAISPDDFIMILAVSEQGLSSDLDFETGSVFVWDPDYQEVEEEGGSFVTPALLIALVFLIVLAVLIAVLT